MSKYSQIFDPYSKKPKEYGTLSPNDTLVSTGPNLRHGHGFQEYREVKKGEYLIIRVKIFYTLIQKIYGKYVRMILYRMFL